MRGLLVKAFAMTPFERARSSLPGTAKNALDAVPLNFCCLFLRSVFIGVRASEFFSKMVFARRDQDGGGLGVHLT
jgi:hypothetical protein